MRGARRLRGTDAALVRAGARAVASGERRANAGVVRQSHTTLPDPRALPVISVKHGRGLVLFGAAWGCDPCPPLARPRADTALDGTGRGSRAPDLQLVFRVCGHMRA